MPYIYSTLTGDQEYALYEPAKDMDFRRIPKPLKTVLIYGGANVLDKRFCTPKGVATHVTDDDLKILEQIKAFQKHKKDGFVTVDKAKHDAEKVAKDMSERDRSAQLEDRDFETKKKPVVKGNG